MLALTTTPHLPLSTRDRVDIALRALGDTSCEVAANLDTANIRGIPQDAARCPIALYIWLRVGVRIRAFNGSCVILEQHDDGDDRVNYPPAVRCFVGEFDQGMHSRVRMAWTSWLNAS